MAKAHPKMSVEMCFISVGVRPPAGHGETIKGGIVLCLQGADGPGGERDKGRGVRERDSINERVTSQCVMNGQTNG